MSQPDNNIREKTQAHPQSPDNTDVRTKCNINQKLEQLKTKVEWFYSEDFDLSKATQEFKSAAKLAKDIESDLEKMKNDIKVLAEDFN